MPLLASCLAVVPEGLFIRSEPPEFRLQGPGPGLSSAGRIGEGGGQRWPTPPMARRLSHWIGTAVACLALSAGTAARAAEIIVFRFGEFSRTVSVPSLVTFTETGTVNQDLRSYLQLLNPPSRVALRTALNQRVPVNAVMASNFLSTPLGQRSLQQLVKVIDQPAAIAEPALSSALILGSARKGDLRLIDVLQAYPTQTLPVNVAAVLSLARSLSLQFNLQNRLFPQITSINGAPAQGPDLSELGRAGEVPFRKTPFSFTGRHGATITAVAYLPATATAERPAPLVAIAPGLNTNMNSLLYVGRQLASHGYAVAALNFPFTSGTAITAAINGTGTIPPPNAWYSQPLSVSDLIDQVEQRWGARVNTDAVGVIGQSLGGYTVTALAGAELDWDHLVEGCAALNDPNKVVLNPAVVWQCDAPGQVVKQSSFRDPRVKAAVAVNPVTNPIFSPTSLKAIAAPVLFVSGTNDIFAPPVSQQLIPFTAIEQPGSLLALQHNGTHLSFLNGNARLPQFVIGPDRPLARQELRGMALAFFNRHVRDQASAPPLAAPTASSGVLSGSDPLPLLITPRFSREELNQVDPGLREFP
jgi:predicted dienelactone hydrolase